MKFTLLTRDVSQYLVDRYSERKQDAATLRIAYNCPPSKTVPNSERQQRHLASRLRRGRQEAEVVIRGVVAAIASPTLSFLGVIIQTNGSTDFEHAEDTQISATEFVAGAAGRSSRRHVQWWRAHCPERSSNTNERQWQRALEGSTLTHLRSVICFVTDHDLFPRLRAVTGE